MWYSKLNKSRLTPPDYIFGVVWPILYVLMFVALFKLITNCKGRCNVAITLFFIQLCFNVVWTTIFFRWRNIGLALIDLVLTWGFTLLTIGAFYQIDRISAYLLVPYGLWLSFALYLNMYIYINN